MHNSFEDTSAKTGETMSEEALLALGVQKIVYIRETTLEELGDDLHGQIEIGEDEVLFGVFGADGSPLAVLNDRDAAFAGARQYNFEPVSVH
ncbi:MAG: DUF1150 family protein [Parvibaculaceae bacterium]|mgnify:CR=1 FL=1|nr:DUF1150 family protein [Parvibaculaceae bacterium]